jgi:hypothetical protein
LAPRVRCEQRPSSSRIARSWRCSNSPTAIPGQTIFHHGFGPRQVVPEVVVQPPPAVMYAPPPLTDGHVRAPPPLPLVVVYPQGRPYGRARRVESPRRRLGDGISSPHRARPGRAGHGRRATAADRGDSSLGEQARSTSVFAQPSILRNLICPLATRLESRTTSASSLGSEPCVFTRRRNSSWSRSMTFVLRSAFHCDFGNRKNVRSSSPPSRSVR